MSFPPSNIRPDILRFCKQISPDVEPVWVEVTPALGAEINDCFGTIDKAVKKNGGEIVIGWDITEWPGVFMEAEFHAIWKSNDGTLIDLSPKPRPYSRILFLRDSVREYTGYKVDNIRIPLNPDPIIARFIELSELMHEDMRKNNQLDKLGNLAYSPEYDRFCAERQTVEIEMIKKYENRYIEGLREIGISINI